MQATSIRGGTEKIGVPATAFRMPQGMAIRYDKPADDICDYITGYHAYAAVPDEHTSQVDWFLPGTANVRLTIGAGPIAVDIGSRTFDPLPVASLFGPTSHALKATTHGGLMIGFGISAIGWARLCRRSASQYANRIVAATDLLPEPFVQHLVASLADADGEHMIKPILDALLRPLLASPHPDEPAIRALMKLITYDGVAECNAAADALGISPHSLRRISLRFFGLNAKLLLIRARFLRSFLKVYGTPNPIDYSLIDRSYHDVPHFLRDARQFLGMTPRRFMSLNTPFLDGSVRARAAVLGDATQALHRIAIVSSPLGPSPLVPSPLGLSPLGPSPLA